MYCEKKMATWFYMPGSEGGDLFACDDCVPRGCSCNEPDEQDIPCCEWDRINEEDFNHEE